MKQTVFSILVLSLALFATGCIGGGSANKPPRIEAFTPSQKTVAAALGGEVNFSVTAKDADGDTVNYLWSMTGDGTLVAGNSENATWRGPQKTGAATVKVEVTGKGGVASQTWSIFIGTPLPPANIVYVTEDIETPTSWMAENVYVIDNSYDICVKGSLTIQPGTIIKFGPGNGIATEGSGLIEAVGTSAFPIVFTSLQDDVRGGKASQDPGTATPDIGDWAGVFLGTLSGSQFDFCEFYYGGGGTAAAMLDLGETRDTKVTNCVIAFSEGSGLDLGGVPDVTLAGNTFYGNERPLVIHADLGLDDTNVFHNPLRPSETNTYQGIFVEPGSEAGIEFTTEVTWGETEAAFILSDEATVLETGKLKLLPGVTVKLDRNELRVFGVLEAKGAAHQPIVFTSVNDDQYGGKSNGTSATSPVAGDWDSIYVALNAEATFDHCRISYGGTKADRLDKWAALSDGGDSAGTAISNTTFVHNLRGLDLLSPQSSITSSAFLHNEYPLRVSFDIDTDNSLSIQTNTHDAIYVGGRVSRGTNSSINWLNTQVPYVLNETAEFYRTAVYLGTGTIVRVWLGQAIRLYDGAALYNFEAATFTSYRDVARGGNVGGGYVAPANDDWVGIWDHRCYRNGTTNLFYATHY